jgi:hypothetical protein
MTMARPLLLSLLLALAALPAGAEDAAAPADPGAEGEGAASADPPPFIHVDLMVGTTAYIAEVAVVPAPPADLRLLRGDGETMADQGYLVAELGAQGCREAGYRFDAALPAILAEDGSWKVPGGCR